MNLSAHARHIDFVPIEDFNGYMGACDIVLNLRYPTVGESSGTLLRALGMGKAVVVSDVGSFREYPDEICLKAPVDASEEEHLFEYLNLLVSRPEVARALGARARAWVQRECSWETVARRYARVPGSRGRGHRSGSSPECAQPARSASRAEPEPRAQRLRWKWKRDYITSWAPAEDGSRAYVESHLTRLEKTLAITPPGGPEDRVLEMGAYLQITPALKTRLGYGEVRGCYYGTGRRDGPAHRRSANPARRSSARWICSTPRRTRFPYADGHFSTVLCCELLEHLAADPMHMMGEINRILKPGGHLVLTTPNLASLARAGRNSARLPSATVQRLHPASQRRGGRAPCPRVHAQ